MARITVEDCLEHESNRFALVKLASVRAKQLLEGKLAVTDTKGNRAIVSALREIAAGKVHFTPQEVTNNAPSVAALTSVFPEKKPSVTEEAKSEQENRDSANG